MWVRNSGRRNLETRPSRRAGSKADLSLIRFDAMADTIHRFLQPGIILGLGSTVFKEVSPSAIHSIESGPPMGPLKCVKAVAPPPEVEVVVHPILSVEVHIEVVVVVVVEPKVEDVEMVERTTPMSASGCTYE